MNPFKNSHRTNKEKDSAPKPVDRSRRNHWGERHDAPRKEVFESTPPHPSEKTVAPDRIKLVKTKKRKVRRAEVPRDIPGTDFDKEEVRKYMNRLLPGEEIKRVYYRHWVQLFYDGWWISFPVVLFIACLVLVFIASNTILLVANLVLALIIAGLCWWVWENFRNDRLILTSIRIVQRNKVIATKEDSSEIRLEKAQEVRLDSNRGPIEWIFKVGTITVTSVGQGKIIFKRVADPQIVRKDLDESVLQWRFENNEARKQRLYNRMEARIRALYEPPSRNNEPKEEPQLSLWERLFPGRRMESFDEKGRVVYTWHTHPYVLVKQSGWNLVQLLFTLIIFLVPVQWLLAMAKIGILTAGLWVIFLVLTVYQVVRFLYIYIDWRNDRFIIKYDELMTVRKLPFGFDETIGVIKIFNIQDVQSDKNGFWANTFDFGTVTISAAGTGEPLKFLNVPNPEQVEEEVSVRIERAKVLREDMEDNRTMDAIHHFVRINEDYQSKRRQAQQGGNS